MKSSFDLQQQQKKTESKIVVALERISEAFRVLLWNESKESGLSPIQVQVLIFLHFHEEEKCRIGYLAQEFNMTKATMSESVKTLLQKGLLEKWTDVADSRSFTLRLTSEGTALALKFAGFAGAIEKPLTKLSSEQKQALLSGLLQLIYDLHKAGVITQQRMCYTCSHFQLDKQGSYCRLMQTRLLESDLRIDCPEHVMK